MKKYRLFCETENISKKVISSELPTVCPSDSAHTIKAESVSIIENEMLVNDGTPVNVTLDDYKTLRINEIDARTRELISQGFVYDFNLFSTSDSAQRNWIAIYTFRDSLTYPVNVSTADDGEYSLPDSATLAAMVLTGLGTVEYHYTTGRSLKLQVKAATTELEVDAVVDNR